MPGKVSEKQKLLNQLIESAALELELIDSSDEDEADEIMGDFDDDYAAVMSSRYTYRSKVPKSRKWFDDILPRLDEGRFKQCIRVSRFQLNVVQRRIENHPCFHGQNSSLQFPVSTQLAIVLYRLGCNGDGASVMKMSSLFGIGDGGTLDKITKRVFKAVLSLCNQEISWPNTEERNTIVGNTINELPRCVGYLDGSDFPLAETPTLDHVSYFSRKQRYAVKAQVVCDNQLRIRHIVVGYPGSVHDARIFGNCQIALEPSKYFSDSQYLAADSAYRLTETVVTPFRRNSTFSSSDVRQKFNKYFSRYRVRVEHCFGVLKERFPSLKEIRVRIKDASSHKFVCQWILVCCILHNILLPYDDEQEFAAMLDTLEMEDEHLEANEAQKDERAGDLKRQALFSLIMEKI